MRWSSTAFFLVCLSSAPLHGQASRSPPPKPTPVPTIARPTPQAATVPSTQSLSPINLEQQWTIALVKRDTRTFDRMLAPNFVYTEDAAVMTRNDVIKSVTGSDRVESARNESMRVHVMSTSSPECFISGEGGRMVRSTGVINSPTRGSSAMAGGRSSRRRII
jgi:hypothetical protein